ncbi:MAG: hypothetical protein HC880_03140 [Bacteroidia bacterium]|nr:hypothetical protein [Bacteroidia bacterium]
MESVLVFVSLLIILGYIFGIDIPYNLFLLLGLHDYRSFYEFFIATYLVILSVIALAKTSQIISAVKVKPAITFIASFIILVFLGAFILMMPAMTTAPGGAPFLTALFTSASASCVTGLSVVTVASYFTFKGQLVILILLQLGGIGIVSFATFFAGFLSQGVGMKQQAIIQDVLSSESLSSARKLLQQVILLTFFIEAVGALAIFFTWGPDVNFYSPITQDEELLALWQEDARQIADNAPLSAQADQTFETGPVDIRQDTLKAPNTKPSPTHLSEDVNLPATADSSAAIGADEDHPALEILFVEPEDVEEEITPEDLGVRINNSLSNKIYYSVFHSISAFCNAGFSIFPNGLAEPGVDTSYAMHVVVALIIIFGSMGFPTIQDVFSPRKMRERMDMPWKQWTLGSQISINMAILLIIFGMVCFYFAEQGYTLINKNLFESLVTSFFQSVSTRTAGFNTVSLSLSDISQPTYIIMIVLMFIGAAPGSTGGGHQNDYLYALDFFSYFQYSRS